MAAANGTATSANCFVRIAAPSRIPAHPARRRSRKANASTISSSVGASAVPNHAARTTIGFAASSTPSASFSRRGPGKSSAAGSSANDAATTSQRTSSNGEGSTPHAAAISAAPGKYAKWRSAAWLSGADADPSRL